MPAPDCCTATGVDCTPESFTISQPQSLNPSSKFKPEVEFNPNSWFSDLDLNAFLELVIHKPEFNFINPIFVPLLLENRDLSFNLLSTHGTAKTIFVPILVVDCHWILLVYDNQTNSDYWMDPIEEVYNMKESVKSCRSVHCRLNVIFQTNHRFIECPMRNIRFQNNGHDCGPLICFYALQTVNKRSLNDAEIPLIEIRKIAHSIVNNCESGDKILEMKNLIGGGASNETHELRDILQFFFKEFQQIHILDGVIVDNILCDNRHFIMDNVKFKTFKNVIYIAAAYRFNGELFLFIYKYIEATSVIFNLTNGNISPIMRTQASKITGYLNVFLLDGKCSLVEIDDITSKSKAHVEEKFQTDYAIKRCLDEFQLHLINPPRLTSDIASDFSRHTRRILKDSARLINSRINANSIISFFNAINCNSLFNIISPTLSTALFDDNWQCLSSFLNVASIKESKIVFCLILPPEFHLCLIILDFSCWEYYILNPTSDRHNEDLELYCTSIVDKLSQFCLMKSCKLIRNSCPYLTIASGMFSNLLICGYMENFINDCNLSDIDIEALAKKFDENLCSNLLSESLTRKPMSSNSNKQNIDDRITKCDGIVSKCLDLNDEEIYNVLVNNFPVRSKSMKQRYGPYLGVREPFQLPDKFKLRLLFKNNMKHTVNKILCQAERVSQLPSIDDIVMAFEKPTPQSTCWPLLEICHISSCKLELTPISKSEVVSKLQTMKNSSPGPDGINYSHLSHFDPEGNFLSLLFNKIIDLGRSPTGWKNFQTTLIPKPGKLSYRDISSWRPIALANSSYKVFTSILCDRLTQWTNLHQIIHRGQKGGSHFEGCVEHNATLNAVFEHVKSIGNPKKSSATIAWLDIRNAFPSVPHEYMWNNLRAIGVGERFVHTLCELYENTSTFYKCDKMITREINVNVGVKQGCPISMILFALAINPILNAVEAENVEKFDLMGHKVQILAYADDVAIVANNPEDLQQMINTFSRTAKQCNLYLQPSKCAYLTLPYDNKMGSEIIIDGTPIQKLQPGQFYQYLGVPVGDKVDQSPYDVIQKLTDDAAMIKFSQLWKYQKLRAIKTFLFPRIIFAFRTREIKRIALEAPKDRNLANTRGNPSSKLRKILKEILSLPVNAETCYLYVATKNGGAGLWDLYDEYNLQQLVQAFKLLNCQDEIVADIMQKSLVEASSPRLRNSNPSMAQCLSWINGKFDPQPNNKSHKTWWNRVRRSIHFFRTTHSTMMEFEFASNSFNLRITDATQKTIVAQIKHRHQITKILHDVTHTSYLMKWASSSVSNFLCQVISHNFKLNKIIFAGQIGPFAWDFIHRARTNTLQTNARPMVKDKDQRKCRRCHDEWESMTHILQVCRSNKGLITYRHDACLDIIYRALRSPRLIIAINETIKYLPGSDDTTRMRIDIYCEDVSAKTIYLADLKCPIDMPETIANANAKNLEHYRNLKKAVQDCKPSYRVELVTIIVGSLGTIPDDSMTVLEKIGVPQWEIKQVATNLSIMAIRHSARIWHFHSTSVLINFQDPSDDPSKAAYYSWQSHK